MPKPAADTRFDVIVLGVGAMGSATCYHLARRGVRVLGVDQFELGHDRGSSHGDVRLTRKAYFEHERYVPLLQRAFELWDEIGQQAATPVLLRAGLLVLGPPHPKSALPQLLSAARKHGVAVESLSRDEIQARFEGIRPGADHVGVLEPGAGYLAVEEACLAHARLARDHGASIHTCERVVEWSIVGDGVQVTTDRTSYAANRLVVTAGPWTGQLLRDLGVTLVVKRVPQFWFDADARWSEGRASCFAFDLPEGFFYGFPARPGRGLKLAEYHPIGPDVQDPASPDRTLRGPDYAKLARLIRTHLDGVEQEPRAGSVCMYTMSPDEHFIIDRHPSFCQVAFAGGFSGHGFKFASVVGEVLADLTMEGRTALPIDFLRLARFAS